MLLYLKEKLRSMKSFKNSLMIRSKGNYINSFKQKNEQGRMDNSLEVILHSLGISKRVMAKQLLCGRTC